MTNPNQVHIDKIVSHILKARKLAPDRITALASVITALSKVQHREEQPNQIPEGDDDGGIFNSPPINIGEVTDIEIDGVKRKIS